MNDLARRLLAQFLGTAFLLVGIIGSGIMAERLTDDVGLQLLANAAAIVGVLYAVILMFGEAPGRTSNRRSHLPTSFRRSGRGSTSAQTSQPKLPAPPSA